MHQLKLKAVCGLLAFLLIFPEINSVFAQNFIYESYIGVENNKFELIGAETGGQLGAALAVADFNADGLEDVVMGAPFASSAGKEWNGIVTIEMGKKTLAFKKDYAKEEANTKIYGENGGDQFGTSLSTGDYNGDGFDDLAIGAYNAYVSGERAGKVYVFYGQTIVANRSIDFGLKKADMVLTGVDMGGQFGLGLSTVDVNGDSYDDLLVGAPEASSGDLLNNGELYAFYGSKDGFGNEDELEADKADIKVIGQQTGERFAASIAAADIDANGRKEVIIGAYKADVDEKVNAGKVYIYKFPTADLDILVTPAIEIQGNVAGAWFGYDIATGNLDGEAGEDFAISSFPYEASYEDAKVSVFYGDERFKSRGSIYNEALARDIVISDTVAGVNLGTSVLLDDFNGDGKGDITLGAPGVGKIFSEKAGELYSIFSSEDGFESAYNLKNRDFDLVVYGENSDDWFAYELGGGDLNGDGYAEIIVGSRYSEGSNGVNNGKVFVLKNRNGEFGKSKEISAAGDRVITRGEFIERAIESFDIANQKAEQIEECNEHLEFCLFDFLAISSFEDLSLEENPVLYPDVPVYNPYYEAINLATKLRVVNGYIHEENTPFGPDREISRVQALKVILSLNELVEPKYKFELEEENELIAQESYFEDVDPRISHMWWYPRFVNFAVDSGIIERSDTFRPDDILTESELEEMIANTKLYLESGEDQRETADNSESDEETEL